MKVILGWLLLTALLSVSVEARERKWEKAKVLSHSLQRQVGPHGGKPVTLDTLIIDLGGQTYTLGRVTGWSGNHTKKADLASDYVQAYRPWGPVPLSRATTDPNLLPLVMLGLPGLLFVNHSYSMTVLDNRGKEVGYEVMSIGEPEKPEKETLPTVTATPPPAQTTPPPTPIETGVETTQKKPGYQCTEYTVDRLGLKNCTKWATK